MIPRPAESGERSLPLLSKLLGAPKCGPRHGIPPARSAWLGLGLACALSCGDEADHRSLVRLGPADPVLVFQDVSVFTAYDRDHSGTLDTTNGTGCA